MEDDLDLHVTVHHHIDEEGFLRQEISELARSLRDVGAIHLFTYRHYDYWFSVRTKWAKQLRQARGRLKKLTSK